MCFAPRYLITDLFCAQNLVYNSIYDIRSSLECTASHGGGGYGSDPSYWHVSFVPSLPNDPTEIRVFDAAEREIGDLLACRDCAIAEGWRGGIEGLDLTLAFLRRKRSQVLRSARTTTNPKKLDMPSLRKR